MTLIMLAIGIFAALAIAASAWRVPNRPFRAAAGAVALLVLFVFVALSSIRLVEEDEIGVIVKNFGPNMPPGQIIALNGEKGPQARILGPGWHFWYWPGLYDVEIKPVIEIKTDEVGLVTTLDGRPLPPGQAFAPEWEPEAFSRMLDAEYFLTAGQGFGGPQASVLKPRKWRINPKLYAIERVPVTNIEKATVAVVKSNVGDAPPGVRPDEAKIVDRGQRGIWRQPFTPDKLYLNTKAYEITVISTRQQIIRYGEGGAVDESEIEVRTSDGFTFPVDVRIEYQIKPEDAALVVAELGDDKDQLQRRMASTVRAIFRNNAEQVKALDYVQQRSHQETQSLGMLSREMAQVGVTVTAVRIGDVGDEASLGTLLKTQTDREIALQEQLTFQEQQRAAEQKKALTRTEQEAEKERDLADATYGVMIAEQTKQSRIIEADADAEAIRIRAEAQATAYQMIAEQIGQGNAALVELLKIVGERNINITPRVMVVGDGNGRGTGTAASSETTALIGTMLDTMISKEEPPHAERNVVKTGRE